MNQWQMDRRFFRTHSWHSSTEAPRARMRATYVMSSPWPALAASVSAHSTLRSGCAAATSERAASHAAYEPERPEEKPRYSTSVPPSTSRVAISEAARASARDVVTTLPERMAS